MKTVPAISTIVGRDNNLYRSASPTRNEFCVADNQILITVETHYLWMGLGHYFARKFIK